jgi:hypothetical protein
MSLRWRSVCAAALRQRPTYAGAVKLAYDYREFGADLFDRIDVNPIRRSLVRRLERLGNRK